jgi:hypothetical protein
VLTLGALSFAVPAALVALAALPLLWYLLRATPPKPRRIAFPPLLILAGLVDRDRTAVRTPWWLIVLRLALASALILAAAEPLLSEGKNGRLQGPLLIVVDDGWAAAKNWPLVRAALARLSEEAGRSGQPVLLLPTALRAAAAEPAGAPIFLPAGRLRTLAESLEPKPWAVDRAGALAALKATGAEALRQAQAAGLTIVWLADGLATTTPTGAGQRTPRQEEAEHASPDRAFVTELQRLGPVTVYLPEPTTLPLTLTRVPARDSGPDALVVSRPRATGPAAARLRLADDEGQLLASVDLAFPADARKSSERPQLAAEWRARLNRIEVAGEGHAGAVLLADQRWQRPPVGIVAPADADQPLLAGAYYVERALEPLAEVRRGTIETLLQRDLTLLVLIDAGALDPAAEAAVRAWVEAGGQLLRFAGPALARAGGKDALLPVPLRASERTIGGALAWDRAGRLAPFAAESPFRGLAVPDDVVIHRQVLAEPGTDRDGTTGGTGGGGEGAAWARLTDGTPLITARALGQGRTILVHSTANAEWTNLPLSGLFVAMLERIVQLGRGAGPAGPAAALLPIATLDGFGRLGPPPATAQAIAAAGFESLTPGPLHPPGVWGSGGRRFAFNLAPSLGDPQPLEELRGTANREAYGESPVLALRPWLLLAAACLAIVDLAVSVRLMGVLRISATAALAVLALPAFAAAEVPPAALETRLAFVRTGDVRTDQVSRAALVGLSRVVNLRTAATLAAPDGVDPETDELAFYPFLYWPLEAGHKALAAPARQRLKAYLESGGTIVFDVSAGVPQGELRRLAELLDLPPLEPAPDDHLLHRAYYLLRDLPGRWTGETVWVEPVDARVNDGVSRVVAGSHDWGGAWAIDETTLKPILPVVPGGERQRELAYRFGINLVMYVLTGNYKADQIHLPAILERLGR